MGVKIGKAILVFVDLDNPILIFRLQVENGEKGTMWYVLQGQVASNSLPCDGEEHDTIERITKWGRKDLCRTRFFWNLSLNNWLLSSVFLCTSFSSEIIFHGRIVQLKCSIVQASYAT